MQITVKQVLVEVKGEIYSVVVSKEVLSQLASIIECSPLKLVDVSAVSIAPTSIQELSKLGESL